MIAFIHQAEHPRAEVFFGTVATARVRLSSRARPNIMEKVVVRIASIDSSSLRRTQRLVLVMASIPLVLSAWERLQAPGTPDGFERLLIVLLLASAVINVTIALLIDRIAKTEGDLLERLPLAITGLLYLFDAADKMRHGSHALHIAYFLVGVLNLALAFAFTRLRSRRTLTANGSGIVIPRSRLRKMKLAWSELEDLAVDGRTLRLQLSGGGWVRIVIHPEETADDHQIQESLQRLWAKQIDDGSHPGRL